MKKTLFLVLCLIVASLSLAYDFSYTYSGQTLYYNIISITSTNHTVEVTCPGSNNWGTYTKPTGSLSIPSSVYYGGNYYTVVSIGMESFYNCSGLTSVTIPNSVTSIGLHAFYGCSGLTSILIPNSITSIGSCAFFGCSGLTSITIPNSVTIINSQAFFGCSSLTSIIIPSSVTSIGGRVFADCSRLTSIIVSSGNSVYDSRNNCNAIIKTATNKLVEGCKNTIIPNSVTSIGSNAFYYCDGLTSITIPNSVTDISSGAFNDCSGLTSIIVSSGNSVYDSRNNCNAIIKTATNELVVGCKNTIIPNSVTSIGSNAFDGCSGLTSITIPNSVTSIGSNAFDGCSGLTSITIPNSVTSIGSSAFYGCTGLASITIPNSVTSIGSKAFCDCDGLTSITIPNSVTSIGQQAFSDCWRLVSVNLGDGITDIACDAFSYCNRLSTVRCAANNPPTISGGSVTTFGNCGHTVNQLIVTCSRQSYYNAWSSYFNNITCDNLYTLTVMANNTSYGSVSGGGNYLSGSSAVIIADANNGYHFLRWNDYDTNSLRTVVVSYNMSYTAIFSPNIYTITVNTNNSEWGSVIGVGDYIYGSVVTLTAAPSNAHCYFDNWEDGTTNPSRIVTVLSDTTFTAFFSADHLTVVATSANPDMGFVTGDGSYDYGSSATITAHPLTGYKFLHWNDGNTNASRTFIVSQDCEFVAYFGPLQGIDEVSDANSSHRFSLYPNPAAESVTLRMNEEDGEAIFTVYDISGKTMLKERITGGNAIFSVVDWPQGVYYVKINYSDGNTLIGRFIVK